jgi:hypothetical protein
VVIPEKDLMAIVKIRGCKHTLLLSKHCPECGKPMWIEEKQPVQAYEDYQSDGEKFFGLDAILSVEHIPENRCLYVGEIYKSDWEAPSSFRKIPDLEMIKTRIKKALSPRFFWNEDMFGIHTLLLIS